MSTFHPHARRDRAAVAVSLVALMMCVLAVGFFRVQILRWDTWVLRSEDNRFRPITVPAPRGTIFDRNGRILADDVPGYRLSLSPQPADSSAAVIQRIREFLPMSDASVERLIASARSNPLQVLVLDEDAPAAAVDALEERRLEFPSLIVERLPRRRYPAGDAIAHVLGYIAEIGPEELEMPEFEGYTQRMWIGQAGVERQYESLLRGRDGVRAVEVDVRGRIVGPIEGVVDEPARAGGDIRLTIDRPLMEFIHSIWPDTLTGAVVALDPADGGVLALYSAPTYDPNVWVGGIDTETYEALITDDRLPLLDRTVNGRYPPASTWKLATAAIGLELGVITPDEVMPQQCTGRIRLLGRTAACWDEGGHGFLNLEEAVLHSCNVYFYQVAARIGLDRYLEAANRMGAGARCGIDLPQELPGTFPDTREWWERERHYTPPENEVMGLAIGQGPHDATPLKIAQFYVALATDGVAPAPRLLLGGEPGPVLDLGVSRETLEPLRAGLRRTVIEGTARMSRVEYWELGGKTGTGENTSGLDHAWFAGMAGPPGGDPEIVVVVLVEYGLHGSDFAGIGAKAADFYLRRKYGMPVDTIQTLREHYNTGTPAPWAVVPASGG